MANRWSKNLRYTSPRFEPEQGVRPKAHGLHSSDWFGWQSLDTPIEVVAALTEQVLKPPLLRVLIAIPLTGFAVAVALLKGGDVSAVSETSSIAVCVCSNVLTERLFRRAPQNR